MYDGNKNNNRKSTLQAVPNSQVRSEEKEQAKTVSNVFFSFFCYFNWA